MNFYRTHYLKLVSLFLLVLCVSCTHETQSASDYQNYISNNVPPSLKDFTLVKSFEGDGGIYSSFSLSKEDLIGFLQEGKYVEGDSNDEMTRASLLYNISKAKSLNLNEVGLENSNYYTKTDIVKGDVYTVLVESEPGSVSSHVLYVRKSF